MKFYFFFIFFFFVFLCIFNASQWRLIPRVKLIFRNFFLVEESPYNIAIFRIVFFLFILTHLDSWRLATLEFSQWPSAMLDIPMGMKTILTVMPVHPDQVAKMIDVFVIACFLGLVGLFARLASLVAAITGIYVMGIAQCYGKVDHIHHFIWFMLILSASRCSDVLSIDSILRSWCQAKEGTTTKIENSVIYTWPLRFIWLLIGLIYFFPGFWKLVGSDNWSWSDNLKYQLYNQWFNLGGWVPSFRIDQHPWVYKISAVGVICFELLFIVFILFSFLRPIAVIVGLLFHQLIYMFMGIDFFNLQFCYIAFINWAGLFSIRASPTKTQSLKKLVFDERIIQCIGVFLLVVNAYFGAREIITAWPFACYPTFAGNLQEAKIETIKAYGLKGHEEKLLEFDTLKQGMEAFRFTSMINNILAMPQGLEKRDRLKALITLMKGQGMDLRDYSRIRFYKVIRSTQPERRNDPPLSREVLAEINL